MYSISLEWISHHSLVVSTLFLILHTACSRSLCLRLLEEYKKGEKRQIREKRIQNSKGERERKESEEEEFGKFDSLNFV